MTLTSHGFHAAGCQCTRCLPRRCHNIHAHAAVPPGECYSERCSLADGHQGEHIYPSGFTFR